MNDKVERDNAGKKEKSQPPPEKYAPKGWDWTEMGPIFDLWVPSNNEEPYAQILKSRMWDASEIVGHWKGASRTQWLAAKDQIQQCRKYVLTLAAQGRKYHHDWAVWKAIGEIEDDTTFVVWLTRHMEYGWS